jgi:hypothetical protein
MKDGLSGWQERLWAALDAFEALQMAHSIAFANGTCDHVMAQRAEREKALACVHMALETAQPHLQSSAHDAVGERLRARIAALLERETALAERVCLLQKHVLDELGILREGRRVLKGYGQLSDGSPRPRLVNRTT